MKKSCVHFDSFLKVSFQYILTTVQNLQTAWQHIVAKDTKKQPVRFCRDSRSRCWDWFQKAWFVRRWPYDIMVTGGPCGSRDQPYKYVWKLYQTLRKVYFEWDQNLKSWKRPWKQNGCFHLGSIENRHSFNSWKAKKYHYRLTLEKSRLFRKAYSHQTTSN